VAAPHGARDNSPQPGVADVDVTFDSHGTKQGLLWLFEGLSMDDSY
jgi:hypothetical protein